MTNSKLTKYAFNLADLICLLLVILSAASLISVFVPPSMTAWSIIGLSQTVVIPLELINTLLSGLGFYLLIKRKIIGFALIIITSIISLFATKFFHIYTVYYLVALLIIVGLPWALSYKEVINAEKT